MLAQSREFLKWVLTSRREKFGSRGAKTFCLKSRRLLLGMVTGSFENMVEKTFTATGLTCGSCEELIGRAVSKNGGALKGVDYASGLVTVDCEEGKFEEIKQAVYAKGFGPSSKTHSFKGVVKGILGDDSAFAAERKIIEYSIGSLLLVFLVQAGFSFFLFQGIENFWTVFAPLIFLLTLGVVATMAAFSHLSFFKTDLSCMTGMMVGMTMGMTSGFMLGALMGATNGMFVGALLGMLVGIALGAFAGKCCGVMGVMEGMMAGLMSGTMGAMLSVMLLGDNLMAFIFILFIVCVLILLGLGYAVFKESGFIPQGKFELPFAAFAAIALFTTMALTLLMLYGPKSAVVLGV